MYRNLWTNAPNECHEYADYTLDRHFSKPVPSFVPREIFRDYFIGRAEISNIRRFIRFSTVVRFVEFDASKEVFSLRSENLTTGKTYEETFDYVIVATGHFTVPNIPHFEGIETFPGRVVHSHDFRDANQLTDQNVLVIGGGYSAEDITLQAYKYGAKSVTMSYRTKRMAYQWPKNIDEKFLLTKIEGRTVHFPDGTTRDFDSIIYCTGYKHNFPFLNDEIRLVTGNSLYPDGLYKGIFFLNQPRIMYLAMQALLFGSSIFDSQAWYVRDYFLGRIVLPSKEEQAVDIKSWKLRESKLKHVNDVIDFQADYIKDLAEPTKCPLLDLDVTGASLKKWLIDKQSDMINYRNKPHTSTITGIDAVALKTPWIEIKDDSTFLL